MFSLFPWQTLLVFIVVEAGGTPCGALSSPQKPATGIRYMQHTGYRALLLNCVLWWILGHLVVSNGNNLSQFK